MSETTLLIKNLPHCLNDAEKHDFLQHFGAQEVKIIHSNVKKNNLTFATFASKEEADLAVRRLHNFPVLGFTLSAVYAKTSPESVTQNKTAAQDFSRHEFNTFLKKLHAFNEGVDFMQPPPHHLKYCYPGPTKSTLMNILRALETVPKFYTQVLHLMNKMNLPPPFCEESTTDPTFVERNIYNVPVEDKIYSVPIAPPVPQTSVVASSSEESELESDPDEQKPNEIVPSKRAAPQKKQHLLKRIRLLEIKPTLMSKPSQSKISTEEVFEEKKELEHIPKKIELKLSSTHLGHRSNNEEVSSSEVGTFGKIYPNKIPENIEQSNSMEEYTSSRKSDCITQEELAANRISEKDFHLLPVFKNYNAGPPSCRIYIKNLAKTVTTEDISFIYKKYIDVDKDYDEDEPSMFDVRLMQEGRMKGQAFVTFQNIEQAQKAVKETNGFILKEKPMAVVFARSAAVKSK